MVLLELKTDTILYVTLFKNFGFCHFKGRGSRQESQVCRFSLMHSFNSKSVSAGSQSGTVYLKMFTS